MNKKLLLAARRVLPPDLIAPAKASKPRINDTGPEALPPPFNGSRELRRVDRFVPVPEPYLNSIPSVLARVVAEPTHFVTAVFMYVAR